MKTFHFPLKRVRDYKEQLLDKEKAVLVQLQRERDEIAARIAQTDRYILEKNQELQHRQTVGISVNEALSLRYLIEAAQAQRTQLELQLQQAILAVEQQLKVVIGLSQELSGMDKLRDKQYEEYQQLAAKEAQEEILEHIAMKSSQGFEKP